MLTIHDLNLRLGGLKILNNLNLQINEGETVGLIGPNGAGKSSLFNVITGLWKIKRGKIVYNNEDITHLKPYEIFNKGIGRSFQDTRSMNQITVEENLEVACKYDPKVNLRRVFLGSKLLKNERKEHLKKISDLLEKVHIHRKTHQLAGNLSYGQSKLLEIAKIMLSDSKLILLDEPFSGLFPEMIRLITKLIKDLVKKNKTIIFIEHNMKLVEEICDKVIVLDAGTKIAEGSFAEIKKNPTVIEAYLGS